MRVFLLSALTRIPWAAAHPRACIQNSEDLDVFPLNGLHVYGLLILESGIPNHLVCLCVFYGCVNTAKVIIFFPGFPISIRSAGLAFSYFQP